MVDEGRSASWTVTMGGGDGLQRGEMKGKLVKSTLIDTGQSIPRLPCGQCGELVDYILENESFSEQVFLCVECAQAEGYDVAEGEAQKVVRNEQGVPFAFHIGERRKLCSWFEHPTRPATKFGPGTEVEIVGPGEDLAEGPEGQRIAVRMPDGTVIDWPALDLLDLREKTEPNTT